MRAGRVRKTAERVAEEIVHDIVMNCLHTGDHLSLESEMVDRYQASRSSVREALRLLEVQGLIVLKPGPGGGPVVGQVDPANLARTASLYFHLGGATYESILRTQAMLEPLCAQLAVAQPGAADGDGAVRQPRSASARTTRCVATTNASTRRSTDSPTTRSSACSPRRSAASSPTTWPSTPRRRDSPRSATSAPRSPGRSPPATPRRPAA